MADGKVGKAFPTLIKEASWLQILLKNRALISQFTFGYTCMLKCKYQSGVKIFLFLIKSQKCRKSKQSRKGGISVLCIPILEGRAKMLSVH